MNLSPRIAPHANNRTIVGLDLLRWLAALLVAFHHLGMRLCDSNHAYAPRLRPLVWFGWIGVQIFFVISGFVIPYSAKNATLRSFAVSRAVRLFPAVWICATITALDLILTRTPPEFAPNLLSAWFHSITLYPLGPCVDGVYWTLTVETAFYGIIAALLAFDRFRWIGPVMAGIGLLSSTSWILVTLHLLHVVNQPWLLAVALKAVRSRTGMFLLTEHGCYFALGTFLWLGFFHRFTKWRITLIAYFLVGAGCEIVMHSIGDLAGLVASVGTPLTPLCLWLGAMLALCIAVRYNTWIYEAIGVKGAALTRMLGLITYPLYLLHQQNGYIWLRRMGGSSPNLISLIVVLSVILLFSYFVTFFAEQPLQRWLRGRLSPRERASAVRSESIASTVP